MLPESFHHVCVEYAVLLQIVRNCILGEKRRLQPDFSADPFAFLMLRLERVIAASAAAKLRAKIRALNLVELLEFTPGLIAHRARDIDL